MKWNMIERKDFEDAKTLIGGHEALVYDLSEVRLLGEAPEDINWNTCVEARFFNEQEEIHFFRIEDEWKAVIVSDNKKPTVQIGEDIFEVSTNDISYQVDRGRFSFDQVHVREYLYPDEDGQMSVGLTRLTGVERRKFDGKY